ncbi:MAG: hypothetical protein NTY88_08355 [Bacteroidetes bacterium]|nr:hypothetical protein [Bacteroidota bacterium]
MTGSSSVAMGQTNYASGQSAVAMGEFNTASGTGSIAMGSYDTVTAVSGGVALGVGNRVTGQYSFAFGNLNYIYRNFCVQGGYRCVTTSDYGIAIGYTDTAGYAASALGYGNGASGFYSHAVGFQNRATGSSSVAMGQTNYASGQSAVAMGEFNIASGIGSIAVGGYDTADGSYAFVTGISARAGSYGEFVTGIYPSHYAANNASGFDRRDRIFNVGNGTGPLAANRNDAFTILKSGKTGFNTNAPASRADVNGDLALRQKTLALVTGANSDITSVDTMSFYRITGPAGAFSVTGITGGVNGRILILYNTTAQNMTVTNQATSAAANQINTMSGGNLVSTGECSLTMIYDSGSSKWVVLSFTP